MENLTTQTTTDVSISEQLMFNDIVVVQLSANINSENPVEMSYSITILNLDLYFQHKEEIHQKELNFEERIYTKQQEMILTVNGGN